MVLREGNMKKQLDNQQLSELQKLGYKYGPMIGDLIEFLDWKSGEWDISTTGGVNDGGEFRLWCVSRKHWDEDLIDSETGEKCSGYFGTDCCYDDEELCDALWAAVKEVLETTE